MPSSSTATTTTTYTKRRHRQKLLKEEELDNLHLSDGRYACGINGDLAPAEDTVASITIPHDVVVRSLRRRLWKALYEEDTDTAFRAYTATTIDFQQWTNQEKQEQKREDEQRKDKREAQRPVGLKKFGSFVKHHGKHGKRGRRLQSSTNNICNNNHNIMDASFASTKSINAKTKTAPAIQNHVNNTTANEIQFPLLQIEMNPSEPFNADDYKNPTDLYEESLSSCATAAAAAVPGRQNNNRRNGYSTKKRKSRYKQPRLATSFFKTLAGAAANALHTSAGGGDGNTTEFDNTDGQSAEEMDSAEHDHYIDERMTTPFHEVSRCGNGPLVQMMLKNNSIDPNVKNGQLRTALHMVAGGTTRQECKYRNLIGNSNNENNHDDNNNYEKRIGIGPPHAVSLWIEQSDEASATASGASAKKAARAVGRFLHKRFSQPKIELEPDECKADDAVQDQKFECYFKSNFDKLKAKLKADRLDALLALLSYVHPDDGSPNAGEGASINAVDAMGRTALHYAAELGRDDICMALLSSFGIILTVVDDTARTPCELAAEQNYHELAAQLEARALLYTDPYGMDDELMASVLAEGYEEERKSSLVAPYAWFETLDCPAKERQQRLSRAFEGMEQVVKEREEEQELNKFMYSQKVDEDNDYKQDQYVKKLLEDDGKSSSLKDDGETNMQKELKELLKDDGALDSCKSKSPDPPASFDNGDDNDNIEKKDTTSSLNDLIEKIGKMDNEESEDAEAVNSKWNEFVSGLIKDEEQRDEKQEGQGVLNGEGNDYTNDARFLNLDIFNFLTEAHVEQFLTHHDWIVEKALEAFKANPVRAIKYADVDLHVANFEKGKHGTNAAKAKEETQEKCCSICFEEFDDDDDDDNDADESSQKNQWKELQNCEHSFCTSCLGDYLSECARSRSSGLLIPCPHHECNELMSQSEIEQLCPTKEIYNSLKQTAVEKFVSSAYDLRFCPHPNCKGVVKLHMPEFVKQAKVDIDLLGLVGAVCTACTTSNNGNDSNNDKDTDNSNNTEKDEGIAKEKKENVCVVCTDDTNTTYDGVYDPEYTNSRCLRQPYRAHRFCFVCGDPSYHWPVSCEQLAEWKRKMNEEVAEIEEVVGGGSSDSKNNNHKYDEIAQHLWIKANTRPCPKCKAPIEKNEGCNHVTCTNPHCKHEFCWICRKDWKLHNTATGGFFRCNRWQEEDNHEYYESNPTESISADATTNNEEAMNDPEIMMRTYGTSMHESRVAYKRSKEMKRFLHHYTRWNAHSESAALEERMSQTVCSRLAPVVRAAIEFTDEPDFNFGGKGLSFVHSAFIELLECRSILQHSYAFSFYRYESLSSRQYRRLYQLVNEQKAFEQMQSELEILTEQMSDIVARAHLRATQTQIVFLTHAAAEKRNEFSNIMISVLNEVRKEEKAEAATDDNNMSDRYRFGSTARLTARHRNYRSPRATMPTAVDDIRTIMLEHVHRQRRDEEEAAVGGTAAMGEGDLAAASPGGLRIVGRGGDPRGHDGGGSESIVDALRASLDAGVELSASSRASRIDRDPPQSEEAMVEALRASLGEFIGRNNANDADDHHNFNHDNDEDSENDGMGVVIDEDDHPTPRARLLDEDDDSDDGFMRAFAHGFGDDNDDIPGLSDWSCRACTYMNHGGHMCAMCGTFRR